MNAKRKANGKRTLYIALWVVLGIMLAQLVHGWMEMWYIESLLAAGAVPKGSSVLGLGFGYCALPAWAQIGILIAGVGGGHFAGKFFWRLIYIEKRRLPGKFWWK